jgi:thiamine-phosphate pyrophosphorylase
MFPSGSRVYPITDVHLTGLSHSEQVARLIDGGATLIQLREKQLSPQEFFLQADEAVRFAHQRGARVIINDRVDVALAVKADGVHLGQDDMAASGARELLGQKALIGLSTHNLAQAVRAIAQPIDYIAIGPVFTTTSKTDPDPALGLEGIREVRRRVGEFPLIAIGGITLDNAPAVFDAGADSVALISALLADPSQITAKTVQFLGLT